jgi:hypothetical protein
VRCVNMSTRVLKIACPTFLLYGAPMLDGTVELAAITPGQAITSVRTLTSEQRDEFARASAKVHDIALEKQLVQILVLNCVELEQYFSVHLHRLAQDRSMHLTKQRELLLGSNRIVLNILTSLRTFVDHSNTRLTHKFGTASREIQDFKAACSRQYDSQFAYRFMCRLRNYAQHCGMPVGRIVVRDRLAPASAESAAGTPDAGLQDIQIYFNAKQLLNDYNGWSGVAQDLERRHKISVRPLSVSLARSVVRLQRVLERLEYPSVRKEARYLRRLITEVWNAHPDTVPCVIRFPRRVDRKKIRFNMREFPVDGLRFLLPNDQELQRLA